MAGTTADKLQGLIDGKQYVIDKVNFKADTKLDINSKWNDIGDAIEEIETGVDTTDATATAKDILLGKTAYANKIKVEGTIETYNGDNENGEIGEPEIITPLFAPTLIASNKTLTVSDTKNGAFVETYNCYLDNDYITTIDKTLDITEYLIGENKKYKFNARSVGILLDSENSNDINYYQVLFKNQDNSLLHTQVELENETFRYEGYEPISPLGNFYGWNENKEATTRQLEFNINEPKTYYAIYTSEFADSLVLVGEYEELRRQVYAVEIDGNAYILTDNLIYKYDISSNTLTNLEVSFTTRRAVAYDGKIYTQEKIDTSTTNLYIFNPNTNSVEETIVLNISNNIDGFVIYDNKIFFIENYIIYSYDLTTLELTLLYNPTSTWKYYLNTKNLILVDGTIYFVGSGGISKFEIANSTWTVILDYVSNPHGANNAPKAFIGNLMYSFGSDYSSDKYYDIRQYDFEKNTVHSNITYKGSVTLMEGQLIKNAGISTQLGYASAVTIGSAIYLFGFGAVQKYY